MSAPPTPPTAPSAGAAVPTPPAAAGHVAPSASKLPPPPKPSSPFVYLGIPQWLLDYRPKVPSRNMSIFLSVTIGITGAYLYDRRECERLQKEYLDKVRWMSEAPLATGEMARRVKVYGARVPEDGELERSSKWFKRYMRPLLVASGTDYALITGTNPGGLGRTLLAEIRARRIANASKDPAIIAVSAYNADSVNVATVLEERDAAYEANELDGGIVMLGRGALKEYLWALRKGYGEEIDLREEARLEGMGLGSGEKRKDGRWEREEEIMVRELDREDAKSDSAPFDVPEPVGLERLDSSDPTSTPEEPAVPLSTAYAPYRALPILPSTPPPPPPAAADEKPLILPAVTQIPSQPPLLLVPFSHPFGIRQWPAKLLHFFNHRSDVKLGAECAVSIINAQTRPFDSPALRTEAGELQGLLDEKVVEEVRLGQHKDLGMDESPRTGSQDLDFLADTDDFPSHFRKSYRTLPSAHEYARRTYYTTDLPPRLAQARELANGRTPTKAEGKYPPKIESELRKERLEKELKWRRELEGWAVQRSGSGVAWEERWGSGQGSENPFKVFVPVVERDLAELEAAKRSWEELQSQKQLAVEEIQAQGE